MKLLFLYINGFNYTGIPIGLSYLISILKREHEISLFDTTFAAFDYSKFNVSGKIDNRGRKLIKNFQEQTKVVNPDVICISCLSLGLEFGIKMLEHLRNRPTTIFGGVGPTVDFLNLIKKKVVDYICIGYGEECLPMLIKNLEKKADLNAIPNLVYKKDGKAKVNKFAQRIDLTNLPLPDWSLFSDKHFTRIFKGETKRWGNFQLTRGCPFNCSYCVNQFYHEQLGIKVQRFPVEQIIQQMEILSSQYNLEIIRIFDECFGFGKLDYYQKFAKLYKRKMNLPTIVETRPEAITPELIKVLKAIDCISVSIGIEVGNENQRKQILNRNVSNRTIKQAFELLHKTGIRTSSYNMLGFPHDTKELIFETIELNRECKVDFINVFLFSPAPQTKLREYCEKNNLLEIETMVDYSSRSVVKNPLLRKDELEEIFKSFRDFVRR